MAKPSTPSRAPRNAPQSGKKHRYVGALASDDFGRMSLLTTATAHAWAKKKLDFASQSLQVRNEGKEKKARRDEAREYRRAEAGLQAELRESDHRTRLLSRLVKTKVKPEKKLHHTPPRVRPRRWPFASVALPKFDGPVIDRRGERGVFARFRYYSRRTALEGVSQRVLTYCWNGAELDADGNPYSHSNVGETIDEALCAFDHLEQVNWSASSYAKLLMHGILAMDHRQTPDEMMEIGVCWAEEALGRFDLPYLVTLHAPPPDGDQRNWHCHVLWSFRPMERVGDHEWFVGEMLRTDLDNPQAMKLMREMFAGVMTDASFEAGQNQVWTAKSNADRGLPHEPQVHLCGAKTNRARSGEYVADNEQNHQRVLRSKAAVIEETLRHLDEALAKEQDVQRAIVRRWARLPALPMRLPQPAMAATLTATLPLPARGLPLAPAVVIPPPLPTPIATAAIVAEPIPSFAVLPLPVVDISSIVSMTDRRVPPAPSIITRVDFANLRKPLASIDMPGRPARMPPAPPRAAIVAPLLPLAATRQVVDVARLPTRAARPLPIGVSAASVASIPGLPVILRRVDIPAWSKPPMLGSPISARLSPFASPLPSLPALGLGSIYTARRNLAERIQAAGERRKREGTEAAASAARDAEIERDAIQRRRQVAEACRILTQSPRRPYRVEGGRAFVDLDVMGRRERNTVAAVGLGEREVADALTARIRRDRAEDARSEVDGSRSTPPLSRTVILGHIADQQQASTREWVASGRLAAPEAPVKTLATAAQATRSNPASAASVAARLSDRQRGG